MWSEFDVESCGHINGGMIVFVKWMNARMFLINRKIWDDAMCSPVAASQCVLQQVSRKRQ